MPVRHWWYYGPQCKSFRNFEFMNYGMLVHYYYIIICWMSCRVKVNFALLALLCARVPGVNKFGTPVGLVSLTLCSTQPQQDLGIAPQCIQTREAFALGLTALQCRPFSPEISKPHNHDYNHHRYLPCVAGIICIIGNLRHKVFLSLPGRCHGFDIHWSGHLLYLEPITWLGGRVHCGVQSYLHCSAWCWLCTASILRRIIIICCTLAVYLTLSLCNLCVFTMSIRHIISKWRSFNDSSIMIFECGIIIMICNLHIVAR